MKRQKISRAFFTMIILYGLSALFLLTQTQCAQELSPTGGPRDSISPTVVWVKPPNQTLNYVGDEVQIKFSEFIRQPAYGKDIFISPLLPSNPKISVKGKKIIIKFGEELRENSTYVISLTGIKDQNEGNELDGSFTLAFSTGYIIDSMEIRGKVVNPLGLPQKEMSILLFDADSILQDSFFNKRPAYVTKTNERGEFTLPFLRNTHFRIYGVMDKDQSNTYNQPTETIAFPDSSLVVFSDSSNIANVSMISFLPDDRPPALRKYTWHSDSILSLELTEGILPQTLSLTESDTLGLESQDVIAFTYLERQIILKSPRKRDNYTKLSILGLQDSLGNKGDTLVDIFSRNIKKVEQFPLIKKPKFNVRTLAYEWHMPVLIADSQRKYISLQDTGKHHLPIVLVQKSFKYILRPDTILNLVLPHKIHIDGRIFGEKDTVYAYSVSTFDKETFGTFSGKLRIKGYDGPYVAFFQKKGSKPYVLTDSVIKLINLEPGDYSISMILDTDSNGVWTPGSLHPYQLPEKIIKGTESFSIRANWDFEEQEIIIDPNKTPVVVSPETSGQKGKGGIEDPLKGFKDSRPPGSRPGGN